MATFGGGVTAVPAYGQEELLAFSGTWAAGDTWTWSLSTTAGDLVFGLGNFAHLPPTCLLTFKNRVYAGLSSQFNFSDNGDATGWEEQNPGAGFILYLNQYGSQDSIGALSALQGRLAVFARKSIQLWTTDANPANFQLVQTLDNIGTKAPLSAVSLGDYDILFLDDTGIRSLRSREVTLNAFVDDLGLPIDSIVQAALAGYDYSAACGVCEPQNKRYWLFIKDTIYVLSLFRSAKVVAWSTYKPTYQTGANIPTIKNTTSIETLVFWYGKVPNDPTKATAGPFSVPPSGHTTIDQNNLYVYTGTASNAVTYIGVIPLNYGGEVDCDGFNLTFVPAQTAFTPEKFVVFNGLIYCRDTNGKVFIYGGASGTTYDNSVATANLPWLDHKQPALSKEGCGMDAAFSGAWLFQFSLDPITGTLDTVLIDGSASTPNEQADSTFNKGRVPVTGVGTHFKINLQSSASSVMAQTFGSIIFKYNKANNL